MLMIAKLSPPWTDADAGISGSDVRNILPEVVEKRFANYRQLLHAKGNPHFRPPAGLKPCFTPVANPQSNGMYEVFARTLKSDYVRVSSMPNAEIVLTLIEDWIKDNRDHHPHSGLEWRSPREFIEAETESA
jgi:putative transposase